MIPAALQFLTLASATFVLEDAAAIAAGLLAADGRLSLALGITACAAGIWLGDLGLFALGRVGGPALARTRIGRRLSADDAAKATGALKRHAGLAIVGSRFVPGTRLPVYVGAGLAGVGAPAFAAWAALGVAIWTPLLVGAIAVFGNAIADPLRVYLGSAWIAAPIALSIAWLLRRRAGAVRGRVARLMRWEFWPQWLFYAPVVPWVLWLMARRGARAIAAANPGFEDGGFSGESKSAILAMLPLEWTLPYVVVAPGRSLPEDVSFPLILKPDVGQRGAGVMLAQTRVEAERYLSAATSPVIAQQYHPGPYEAGVFYVRRPDQAHGRIFSITEKRFPCVVGDGEQTIAELIASHPRYRMQQELFRKRMAADLDRVPRPGALVRLGGLGNHAQGAIFLDGSDLITPALTARIDAIARQIDGFYIGRFDIRYRDPRGFMAGEDLAIVELNGVTSEATHIYDPSLSLWNAYRTLFEQWRMVFEIGAANLRRGQRGVSLGRLLQLSARHLVA